MLEDALDHLVRGIVDHADDVSVEMTTGRRGRTLQIRVHPDDLGKVIGRGGRTATALRTVMSAVGGGGLVLRFEGVEDRDAAEALRGTALSVPAEALPEVDDPDEFYDHQLVGLAVRHADGRALGEVIDVWHPPASPVLVVRRP